MPLNDQGTDAGKRISHPGCDTLGLLLTVLAPPPTRAHASLAERLLPHYPMDHGAGLRSNVQAVQPVQRPPGTEGSW